MSTLLEKLKAFRDIKADKSDTKHISDFAKGIELAGQYYQTAGNIAEIVGKALQKPESIKEISNCLQDVKDRVLDTMITLTENNQSEINSVDECAAEFAEEMRKASQPEENYEDHTETNTENTRAAA